MTGRSPAETSKESLLTLARSAVAYRICEPRGRGPQYLNAAGPPGDQGREVLRGADRGGHAGGRSDELMPLQGAVPHPSRGRRPVAIGDGGAA